MCLRQSKLWKSPDSLLLAIHCGLQGPAGRPGDYFSFLLLSAKSLNKILEPFLSLCSLLWVIPCKMVIECRMFLFQRVR